jgi:hypothetical protein
MKQLFFILFISVLSFGANAQSKTLSLLGTSNRVLDTVVNTATINMTSPILTAYGSGYAVQVNFANVSGTSSLRAILQSSLDGVNWVNHFGVVGQAPTVRIADTLTVTSASPGTYIWTILDGQVQSVASAAGGVNVSGGRRTYFRIRITGTTTGVTTVNASLLPSKL